MKTLTILLSYGIFGNETQMIATVGIFILAAIIVYFLKRKPSNTYSDEPYSVSDDTYVSDYINEVDAEYKTKVEKAKKLQKEVKRNNRFVYIVGAKAAIARMKDPEQKKEMQAQLDEFVKSGE